MDSQDNQTECGSPAPPSSPESQPNDSDCESLPDIDDQKCTNVEENCEPEVVESTTPPQKNKRKHPRNATSFPTVTRLTLAPKVTTPCSAAIILGNRGNSGRRHLGAATKEKARLQPPKVRVDRAYWDTQIEDFKFAYEMKPGKKMRIDSAPISITKFRQFVRALERWVCWGVHWLDSANQTPSRLQLRPDLPACLSHTFPIAPPYLHPTFEFFCDYFIGMTIAYHTYYATDLQSHIMTFCPDLYYIVHYCMSMGIPSFLISLYLLDLFLVKDCYVTMAELDFTISLIAKSEQLDNYSDWCIQSNLMTGHYIEPTEAYNAVFRVVDVISLGVGMDSNRELLQSE